jgi:hypothetical protein
MNESDCVPKKYMELIEKDLIKYKITGWTTKVRNTTEWKRLIWEAHESQQELGQMIPILIIELKKH